MPQVYVIERGTRYVDLRIVQTHNTQVGGTDAAALIAVGYERQDPPANGYVASWIDQAFNFLGLREQEVLAP